MLFFGIVELTNKVSSLEQEIAQRNEDFALDHKVVARIDSIIKNGHTRIWIFEPVNDEPDNYEMVK